MILPQGAYRVTDHVRRLSIRMERTNRDPREQDVFPDYSTAVRASVRAERVRELEGLWAQCSLSAFDVLVKLWHPWDSELWAALSEAPRKRAEHMLRKEGWL